MSYSIHRSHRGTYIQKHSTVCKACNNKQTTSGIIHIHHHIPFNDCMNVSFFLNSIKSHVRNSSCPEYTKPTLVGRFQALSPDIVTSRFARTYVGHDSGAAIYVPACCLCVRMLLHTGAMARTYVGHDSFTHAASAASTYPSIHL